MLQTYKKTLLLASLVTLLPILPGIVLWKKLPDQMATHFDLAGSANGFSSKAFTVFFLPLFCLAILWLCAAATLREPKRQSLHPRVVGLIFWIVPAVSLFCAAMIYPYNLGRPLAISLMSGVFTGFLFLVIGNYLPKIRQNYTVGIRVPWTLADEDNWNRTHRFGGHLWTAGGLVIVLLSLTGLLTSWLLLGLILALALLPCIYSFRRSK